MIEAGSAAARRSVGWRLWAVVPIVLLAVVVWFVAARGGDIVDLIGANPPPADQFDIRRVSFSPGEIRVLVRNPQPDDLTIASVTVDDAIVPFTVDGDQTLSRLRSSTIVIPFDWVEDDPLTVGVTSTNGIETVSAVPAAIETPTASGRSFFGYGALGFLVGVVPVALGLLWLPSLRRADPRWLVAFMALTAGLLTFLGVEALFEAFDAQAALPPGLGGPGLVLLGVGLSALGMTFLSSRLSRGRTGATGLALALLVAIGIGVHNLGEGLAIGTSFAFGELQLGTFLVIGFMIHNVTEGLGHRRSRRRRAQAVVVGARRPRRDRGCAGDDRRLDRRLHDERRAGGRLLRPRGGRRAAGRGRGRALRRAPFARRADLGLGDRRLSRRHRHHVGHRSPDRVGAGAS